MSSATTKHVAAINDVPICLANEALTEDEIRQGLPASTLPENQK